MRKLWTIVAVMVAVSFIGLNFASAEDAPKKKGEHKHPPIKKIFKKLDANSDGGICVKELEKSPHIDGEKKAAEVLKKWDGNKDGKICGKEFATALKKIHAHHKKGGDQKKAEHKKGDKKKAGHKKGEHKKGAHKKGDHKKGDHDKKECPHKK